MFKQIVICLLWVGMSSVSLFANDTSFPDCTTIPASELSTSDIAATSAWLYYPQPDGNAINQFRFRAVGTSAWDYSNILLEESRFIENLEPSTQYEYQISYICPSGAWTSFSNSASFTTADDPSLGVDTMQVDSLQMDSLQMDSLQMDTVANDYLLLGDSFASCGDSTVCISLHGIVTKGSLNTQLLWESHVLHFSTIQLQDTFSGALYYETDSTSLANGQLAINFINEWSDNYKEGDTLEIGAVCFIPSFDQEPATTVELDTIKILQKKEDLKIDTLVLTSSEQGTIDLHPCEGIELGGGSCIPIDGVGLTTSSVRETHTYIHNSHHNEALRNQFRYRIKGELNWIYTEVDTKYYRQIFELLPGTTYEFQANQECREDSSFSDYSISHYFTTHGVGEYDTNANREIEDAEPIVIDDATCEPVDSSKLEVSTIKQYFAYVYTPQPYGPINNQFRYRIVGSSFWFYTSISPTYYRWLRGLRDGTLYEYQVSHECSEGVWSPYSGSYRFVTLPSINLTEGSTNRAIHENAPLPLNPSKTATQENQLRVFPNPSTDKFTIVNSGVEGDTQARLMDVNGKVLQTIVLTNNSTTQVNIRPYPKGMYILEVKGKAGYKRVKLVKQ